MKLFETKVAKRLSIAKWIGFLFWLSGFIFLPIFGEVDMMFRVAILLWYTTLWWLIWVFGYMDKHPIFSNWNLPWYFRWTFLWAWMNFVLALFWYNNLVSLMQWTCLEWWSPFWIILEWAIIWMIIDYFATKFGGEWKELIKWKFF